MQRTYKLIHTFKDKELYGESYQPVHEVLSMDEENKHNIFDELS
mgnify:CR=1 FL=1